MKQILALCCLLAVASAGPKEKKTTLEDIEREYVINMKRTKLTPPPPPPPPKIASPAPSPTQFGFVPTKTIANYVRQEPKINYVPPEYTPQIPQLDYSQSQYASSQQYNIPSVSQKYPATSQQYNVPSQKYSTLEYSSPQVYVPQIQQQYPVYENFQYITDNSIAASPGQQYYTPQYVYLQQYTSPSTAVQTVVEPKGGLQYVMYVPTYVPSSTTDQSQNYENVAYTTADTQEPSSAYQLAQTSQTAEHESQPEQVQYTQPRGKQVKTEYVLRKEPKSLLDSYVPSYLQLQYYRQAQQNAIQEPAKIPQSKGNKNYRSVGAETSLSYRLLPSPYRG